MHNAKFLNLFNHDLRDWAIEQFTSAIRAGATDADAVVFDVLAAADKQAGGDSRSATMQAAIQYAPFGASAFAANAIWWEKLSPELKLGSVMPKCNEPATPCQIDQLVQHGYNGPVDSKEHARVLLLGLRGGAR
jgi:hypothetical protein